MEGVFLQAGQGRKRVSTLARSGKKAPGIGKNTFKGPEAGIA